MLKSRSGLGFQYNDGAMIVDDPRFWNDFLKIDLNAKNMNIKKWSMFEDWEEIFGKDRATGEFAERPLDAAEEIQRSQCPGLFYIMTLGFSIDVDGDEEDDARGELATHLQIKHLQTSRIHTSN